MSEMIERVARAIADNTLGMSADYEYAARAAIMAMREPTEGMALAVDGDWGPQLEDNWRKMIDEALK